MCKDKRQFFQVVDMSGSEPKTKISFNPSVVQFWAMLFGKLAGLAVLVWGLMIFAAEWQFEKSLKRFHETAQPQILEQVDQMIESHRITAEAPFLERIHQIENAQGQNKERMLAIQGTVDRNTATLNRIDAKIDRLLESR